MAENLDRRHLSKKSVIVSAGGEYPLHCFSLHSHLVFERYSSKLHISVVIS